MMIFVIIVARYLGERGLGQYAFISSVVFLGNVLTTFGMDTFLIREIGRLRHTDTPVIPAALVIQLVLATGYLLLVQVGSGLLPRQLPETIVALRWYSLALWPLAFTTIFSAILRAYERMDLYWWLQGGTAVFQTIGTFFLLTQGGKLFSLIIFLLITQSVSALLAGWLCVHYLPNFHFRLHIQGAPLRQIWRAGWVLAWLAVLALIYQRLGVFVLALTAGEAETGWFTAATRLADALKLLPYAFFGALFPVMSRAAYKTDSDFSPRLYRLAFVALLFVTLVLAGGITWLAAPLVDWLFGAGYEPSIPLVRTLVWSVPPFLFSLRYSFELVATGKEQMALRAMIWTLGITAVFFLTFTFLFGLTGAGWAVVLGETAQALILWQFWTKIAT